MKKHLKHIVLFPLSLLYGLITATRNWLFENEILKSTAFDIPVISIGNIAVGGTGKTPHTELILNAVQNEWQTAMLSRGYKRRTKGFVIATEKADSNTLGDEPFQVYQKFRNITVAVDEKRVRGLKKLREIKPDLQLAVLDDAFQHRYIHAGLSILLTDYSNLYTRDLMLPAGALREWPSGSKRADIIVVTKCPYDLKPIDMRLIETELKPETNQLLFFSAYNYKELKPLWPEESEPAFTLATLPAETAIVLVAGIVKPEPIVNYLSGFSSHIEKLFFNDHHAFEAKDFVAIQQRYDLMQGNEKIIVVTEKDAARIKSNKDYPENLKSKTYALPIQVEILHNQESLFIQKIRNYVVENTRNR